MLRRTFLSVLLCSSVAFAQVPGAPPRSNEQSFEHGSVRVSVASDRSSMTVTISTGGGCSRHSLQHRFEANGTTVRVWETSEGPDPCEAMISVTGVIPIPVASRTLPHFYLIPSERSGTPLRIW